MNSSAIKHLQYILFVSVLMASFLFAGSTAPAFADPPGRKHAKQRYENHHGRVVVNRHGGHHRPNVKKARHYHRHNPVYRKRPHFSLFIGAPLRSFITTLPIGYSRVVVHGTPYYQTGGIYYQQVFGGYRVVDAPREVVVVASPSVAGTQPAILSEKVQVSAAALNVRTGPGLHFNVIDQVQRGDTLQVLNSEPGWLSVQMPSGQSGWVMDSFTVPATGSASG
jgi:hypothetical protein